MRRDYDEAVHIGLNVYRRLEYSPSCCSAFQIATREFREFMQATGFPYSPQLAQRWISTRGEQWNAHKLKSSRKAMNVLADVMEHGLVTTSLRTKVERRPPYARLPNWSRTILVDYLAALNGAYGTAYLTQIRNACSRFFLFLDLAGATQPDEITHDMVKSFFLQDVHASSKAKDRCDNEIGHCLLTMADHKLIPKTVGLALNKFVMPELVIVAQLPEPERARFSRFFNASEEGIFRSKADYDAAVGQLVSLHSALGYSSFIRKTDLQATRDFRVFMDANAFAYSKDLALEWLELQMTKWSRVKYLAFRRVLLTIEGILRTGTLSTRPFSTHQPKHSLPPWADALLFQYLREREREGCAHSTLDMIRNSCTRFLAFLDHHGVVSHNGVTPEMIQDFQVQDHHSTAAGKNAYAVQVRGFLRFLARKKLVPETIELAMSTQLAPRTAIVTILADDQIDAIYAFRHKADRPMELRNAAILMLGLRMGLRASDIAHLKLTDISWRDRSISFVQQKTGVHLRLPLPVDAGNSLYRYLREGRPPSDSPYVFVHHRAPYCRLGRGSFGRILKAAIAAQGKAETPRGFHVTRKTFASKLLTGGTPALTIAAALGHVGVATVHEYLATDEEQMRLCAIGLQGIPYSGGFRL